MKIPVSSIARFGFARFRSWMSRIHARRLLSSVGTGVNSFKCYASEYQYITERKHQDLEHYLRKTPVECLSATKLHKLLQELSVVAEAQVLKTCTLAEHSMKEYFDLVSRADRVPPRICVKGFHKGKFFDLSARVTPKSESSDQTIMNNSATRAISIDGAIFRQPDIPYAARFGYYVNPRLNTNAVQQYQPQSLFSRIRTHFTLHPYSDQAWLNCWDTGFRSGNPTKEPNSAYKSTLVIPLSLADANLVPFFRKEFLGDKLSVDHSVFGILCMDHMKAGFFSAKDEAVGQTYASLITLSLVHYLTHIERSDIFKRAMNELAKRSPDHFYSIINGKPLTTGYVKHA